MFLLGTEEHVRLAEQAARDLVAGRPVYTAELVASLRDFIRSTRFPIRCPVTCGSREVSARPSSSGARGGRSGGQGGDRDGRGGGMGGGGMGGGMGWEWVWAAWDRGGMTSEP